MVVKTSVTVLKRFVKIGTMLCCNPSVFRRDNLSDKSSLFCRILIKVIGVLAAMLTLIVVSGIKQGGLICCNISKVVVSLILVTFCFVGKTRLRVPDATLLVFFLDCVFYYTVSVYTIV